MATDVGSEIAGERKINASIQKLFGKKRASVYRECLEALDMEELAVKLLSPEPQIDEVLLARLREYSVAAQQHPSEFIAQARGELRDFFEQPRQSTGNISLREFLRNLRTPLVLTGSLQYDDPVNCDIDLFLFSVAHIPWSKAKILYDIRDKELAPFWETRKYKGKPRGFPQFGLITNLELFSDVAQVVNTNVGLILNLSVPLTGIPLFDEDRTELEVLGRRVRTIIASDPLYPIIVNRMVEDCLDLRRERRGGAPENH